MQIILHMGDPFLVNNPCTKRMRAFKDALERQGHRVSVLAPQTGQGEELSGIVYCKTIPLKKKTSFYRLANGIGMAVNSVLEARKLGKADIVLTTSPPPLISLAGWLIAKIKRAKLIYDVRDIWPDVALEMGSFSDKSIYCKLFTVIRDFMLKHADMVTAVSEGKVQKLKSYAPWQNVVKIPNGFDRYFLENKINKKLKERLAHRKGFKCVYMGNLGLAQGLRQLLEIAKKSRIKQMETVFLLYGSGAEEQKLKDYVKEHDLQNVCFEGILPNADMYTVLQAADVSFVSLANGNLKDSVPTKLYEALGMGCPVLLSAEGDSAAILKECGYGIAVSPGHTEALWEAFEKIYKEKDCFSIQKKRTMDLMYGKYSLQSAAGFMTQEMEKLAGISG